MPCKGSITQALFGDCLHKYVILDAIRDGNVLPFSMEYVGSYRKKQSSDSAVDVYVEGINTQALWDSPERLEKITDYIIQNHQRKTQDKIFTALFCISSINVLIQYYALFQQKKDRGKHDLKVATIFSYAADEADQDAEGGFSDSPETKSVAAEPATSYQTVYLGNKDKLQGFIGDYNQMFHTDHSARDTSSFYAYYNDVARRVKNKEVDILLVVNMFLTGFDSPWLNTLYVDKKLHHHGLIQAFSRTNRILDGRKSQGNIVVFRNLKDETDEALALFSNREAKGEVFIRPYRDQLADFAQAYDRLIAITPSPEAVDKLQVEEEELAFVKAFRDLMRIKNKLIPFLEFNYTDLPIEEQAFEDFKSKYLDIYDAVKTPGAKENASVLEDIDFQVELIHRDEINVGYILRLLSQWVGVDATGVQQKHEQITKWLSSQPQLRSKRALIEQFIEENRIRLTDSAFQVQDGTNNEKKPSGTCVLKKAWMKHRCGRSWRITSFPISIKTLEISCARPCSKRKES